MIYNGMFSEIAVIVADAESGREDPWLTTITSASAHSDVRWISLLEGFQFPGCNIAIY